ncbi:MAG: MBL fold metallo-hydrolase [Desulfoferrobacter sp.]
MKLIFLGTRGYIKAETKRHYRHTSLMVSFYGKQVMIDCGEDWLHQLNGLNPRAIVITHAHPDHVRGLKNVTPIRAEQRTFYEEAT